MLMMVDALLITSFARPQLRLADRPPISYMVTELVTAFEMPRTKAANELEEAHYHNREPRRARGQ